MRVATSFRNMLHLYRIRLRARLLGECFAGAGIAAGVALLFASQVASQSLSSSAAQLSRGIVGDATLQLLARDTRGFDERLLTRIRAIPGVHAAAPLLEANASVIGPKGSRSVELVGADESLAQLGGALVRHTKLTPFGGIGAIVLPAPLARSIGVTNFGAEATLEVGGRVTRAPLYSQLAASQIGPLIDSPIVVAPLSFAQEMAGLPGRVTRVLVRPARGFEARVRVALARLAAGRLNVEPTTYDEKLFAKAAAASNQSTVLFAVISSLVGFLFAFNAMLLTVPQRRALVLGLHRDGYSPRAVMCVLALDAIILGAFACALGLALGDELSLHLFRSDPGYLSSGFTVGSSRVVSAQSVAVAIAGGMLAAIVAVLSPLREVMSRNPLALSAAPGARRAGAGRTWMLPALAVACLALTIAILTAAPQLAILGMVSLTAALLVSLPPLVALALAVAWRLASGMTSAVPHVAVMELRASRARVVAITTTSALAVFGAIAIQGARGDLQHGLDNAAYDMNSFTDLWVSPGGAPNLLMTQPFTASALRPLARLPGVTVRLYRGGLLDWGERRVWVIAPPREASPLIPPSQLIEGDLALANARLRAGGWATLSQAVVRERRLHIGERFTMPSPRPTSFRLAAVTTNIGWAPGAMILNAPDFARAWGSDEPSAYNILLAPNVSPAQGRRVVAGALGPGSGLTVQTAEQHAEAQRSLTRQGLARLAQIAILVLAAAVLATTAAISAMIWQRRPRLAKLKLDGFSRGELWRLLLLEGLLLLGIGALSGALLGLVGQQLLDRALAVTVNYPVVQSVAASTAVGVLALVTVTTMAALTIPGRLAARVPAQLALED